MKKTQKKYIFLINLFSCSGNVFEPQIDEGLTTNVNKAKRGGINCFVARCTKNTKNFGILFHKIPKDEILQKYGSNYLKRKGYEALVQTIGMFKSLSRR